MHLYTEKIGREQTHLVSYFLGHDSDLQFSQRELWFLFREQHRRIQLLYNEK